MTATDELCKLLDERGAEFKTHDIITGKAVTWHGSICDWVALPDERGLAVGVYKDYLTPEQAIAATLGRGTCKLEETESYQSERGTVHVLECSNCGLECEHVNGSYDHCPHCLARAVER